MLGAEALDRAADAVRAGKPIVYPTETVYGLGADALDAGETAGGQGSTVVDVTAGTVHRRGPLADDIEAWLRERNGR